MSRTYLAVLLALAVVGCTTTRSADLQVRTDFDADIDFSKWKSFRFATSAPQSGGAQRYPRFDREIRTVIEDNLSDRGYERVEDGIPDFRIAFDYSQRGDHGSDIGRQVANEPTTSTHAYPTKTNTLVVRMLDPITSEVRWEGKVIGFNLDAVQHEAEFRKAIWRLFAEFPPITH